MAIQRDMGSVAMLHNGRRTTSTAVLRRPASCPRKDLRLRRVQDREENNAVLGSLVPAALDSPVLFLESDPTHRDTLDCSCWSIMFVMVLCGVESIIIMKEGMKFGNNLTLNERVVWGEQHENEH